MLLLTTVTAVTAWLTGYTNEQLEELLNSDITYGDFFRNVEVVIADIFKVNKIYRLGGLFNGLFDLGTVFQQAVNLFVGMVQTLLQIGGGLNQGIHCIGCKLFGVALLQ